MLSGLYIIVWTSAAVQYFLTKINVLCPTYKKFDAFDFTYIPTTTAAEKFLLSLYSLSFSTTVCSHPMEHFISKFTCRLTDLHKTSLTLNSLIYLKSISAKLLVLTFVSFRLVFLINFHLTVIFHSINFSILFLFSATLSHLTIK